MTVKQIDWIIVGEVFVSSIYIVLCMYFGVYVHTVLYWGSRLTEEYQSVENKQPGEQHVCNVVVFLVLVLGPYLE